MINSLRSGVVFTAIGWNAWCIKNALGVSFRGLYFLWNFGKTPKSISTPLEQRSKPFEWHFILLVGSWRDSYNGLLSSISKWPPFHTLYKQHATSRVNCSLLNLTLTSPHGAEKFADAPLRFATFPRSLAIALARTLFPPKNTPGVTGVTCGKRWRLEEFLSVPKKTSKFQNHAKVYTTLQFLRPPSKTIINNSRSKKSSKHCMFSESVLPGKGILRSTLGRTLWRVDYVDVPVVPQASSLVHDLEHMWIHPGLPTQGLQNQTEGTPGGQIYPKIGVP